MTGQHTEGHSERWWECKPCFDNLESWSINTSSAPTNIAWDAFLDHAEHARGLFEATFFPRPGWEPA